MKILLTLLSLFSFIAEAEPFKVTGIQIEGLKRTKDYVVHRELEFVVGDSVSESELEEARERLSRTRLFNNVRLETAIKDDGKKVTVRLEERWTTIPIAKLSSGGGVTQYILGVYDPNVLGYYTEMGAQYERLGETNSGVMWFRKPRLFGSKLFLDVQAWRVNRLRTKYYQDRLEAEILTGFLHQREKYYLGIEYEFAPQLTGGYAVEYNDDDFTTQYLDEETKAKAEKKGLPPATKVIFHGGLLRSDQLKISELNPKGVKAEVRYRRGDVRSDSEIKDFYQLEGEVQTAYPLWFNDGVVWRLMAGKTDTTILQYWYYLGGLDRVRGFSDNRFAGSRFWLSNFEYRIPSYHSANLILQHVAFWDVVSVAEQDKDLNRAKGASVGTGLRFIAPKIYRFVGRIDYAQPILRDDDMAISFGVQQFF